MQHFQGTALGICFTTSYLADKISDVEIVESLCSPEGMKFYFGKYDIHTG